MTIVLVLGWVALLFVSSPDMALWNVQSLPWTMFVSASAAAFCLLPGLAILQVLWPSTTVPALTVAERIALALGIGVALPSLLLEMASIARLPWGQAATLAYVGLSALIWLAPQFHSLQASLRRRGPAARLLSGASWPWHALLLAMFIAGLAVRFYLVRDLPAGLWGDSYHHTIIAQLLIDHEGLFSSWEPYAPLASMTYHYGFHADVAFLHWLSAMPATQAVLWTGQWLSALTIPLAYLLTVRVLRGAEHARVAGLCAALFTGFVNTQPIYFVNWGRYTQLAGQLVLPVVVVSWIAFAEALDSETKPSHAVRLGILSAILTACLMLTHYIVAIFGALFVGSYLLVLALVKPQAARWARLVAGSGLAALSAIVLAAPWLINTVSGHLVVTTTAFINGAVSAQRIDDYSTLPPLAPFYLKEFMLWLAAAGLLCALWRRDWRAALFALWTGLIYLTLRPQTLGLPGAGIVDFLAASLALYLTVIPLAAYPLGLLFAARGKITSLTARMFRLRATFLDRLAPLALAIGFGFVMLWGIGWQRDLLDNSYQLLRWEDWRAMDWIRANTPPDARFLVNSFPAYGGTLIAGSDGGWWLPFLTGRKSNLPPITYASEQWEEPDYYVRVNALATRLRGKPLVDLSAVAVDLTQPSALQTLREVGIQYIYHGAHANPAPGQADYIDVERLRQSPAFRLVYAQEGVQIFQLVNSQ